MANTAKTAARLKAETAMVKRAEEFHRREKALSEIVSDYFDAAEQAETTRAAARAKAEKIRAQSEIAATGHERRADQAIGCMLELGESPRAVADTLNVALSRIRDVQRALANPTEQEKQP